MNNRRKELSDQVFNEILGINGPQIPQNHNPPPQYQTNLIIEPFQDKV